MANANRKKTTAEFIREAQEVHGVGTYTYDKTRYINSKTKVIITCPIHGDFEQAPVKHLAGQGCPMCRGHFKKTTEDFITEAREVHGDIYDYSQAEYKGTNNKVCIICPDHGPFWQTPKMHITRKQDCPKCAKYKNTRLKNTEKFIEKAKAVHGDKYDYSQTVYTNAQNKVTIICPTHGPFQQTANSHLRGCGCPACGTERGGLQRRMTVKEFITKARQVHGDKYDYSKINVIQSVRDSVDIICPIHGLFKQAIDKHINGQCGCPKCGGTQKLTTEEFINKAQIIHPSENYDYSQVEYIDAKTPVNIVCPKHGIFTQVPNYHLNGSGCPACGHINSKTEVEIVNIIKEFYNGDVQRNVRNILSDRYELDIYLPALGIAVEYNGMIWHSEQFRPTDAKYRHLNKLINANNKNIRLIQIWEYEYLTHRELVISKLKHLLGADTNLPKVFARKCAVQEIPHNIAQVFLQTNHIQGFAKSTIYLGAYYNGRLIGVMSFKRESKTGEKHNSWELTRFATDMNYVCCGVGGKLFKYFVRIYNPHYVKSFADRRWTLNADDNLYTKLGFVLEITTKPDYHYTNSATTYIHKFNCRKSILMKKYPEANLTEDMTEHEMTQRLGLYRIWDCGLFKYVWRAQ